MLPLSLERDAAEVRVLFPDRPEFTIHPGLQLPRCPAGDAPNSISNALELKLEQVAVGAAAVCLGTKILSIAKRMPDLARNIGPNLRSSCHGHGVGENGSSMSEPREDKPGVCSSAALEPRVAHPAPFVRHLKHNKRRIEKE